MRKYFQNEERKVHSRCEMLNKIESTSPIGTSEKHRRVVFSLAPIGQVLRVVTSYLEITKGEHLSANTRTPGKKACRAKLHYTIFYVAQLGRPSCVPKDSAVTLMNDILL
jgi:hypothetical protein